MTFDNRIVHAPQIIVNTFEKSNHFRNDSDYVNINVLNRLRFSESDIFSAIKKIKANMYMGPDLIPIFLIRDRAVVFCKSL